MTRDIGGYRPGHPWYYKLGGTPLRLREIRDAVQKRGYRGYRNVEFDQADRMAEPHRSAKLKALRNEVRQQLFFDARRYRKIIEEQQAAPEHTDDFVCSGLHTALSLKHNHIFNDIAHLLMLNELLSKQLELF